MSISAIQCIQRAHFVYAHTRSACYRAMSAKPHVGVIGAGLSGLRCADILAQNGARVTILEARDRIGGRVCLNILF